MPDYSGGGLTGNQGAPYGPISPPKPPKAPPAAPTDPNGGGGGSGGGGGGDGTGGGGTPYSGATPPISQILAGDPNYQQLLAFDQANAAADQATMNSEIARQQGYYGSDSDPLSILGRIYQSYQDQNRLISNTLAGHGMIDSGETGWQGARATTNYQRQELDARMKLQDYIDGLTQAYQNELRQNAFNEMQAGWNAVGSFINNNPPTPNGGGGGGGDGSGGSGGGGGDGSGGGGGGGGGGTGGSVPPAYQSYYNIARQKGEDI